MGLDQYVFTLDNDFIVSKETDFLTEEQKKNFYFNEIFYWRKHPNLHGWMKNLYHQKGGLDEKFNCNNEVILTLEDISNLLKDVTQNNLPYTEGFFFGKSYEKYKIKDIDFCDIATKLLKDGKKIYYTSNW
jgi:hypothetical protein